MTSGTPLQPTYKHKIIAFVALALTSTCVGTFMKLSGTGSKGKYRYNPLSAIVLTEAFKLVSSLFIIFGLVSSNVRRKQAEQEQEAAESLLGPVDKEAGAGAGAGGNGNCSNNNRLPRHSGGENDGSTTAATAEPKAIVTLQSEALLFFNDNFSMGVFKHEIGLAAAYSIVNCVTFAIFFHASASNFLLMKACSPVLTAMILKYSPFSSKNISPIQWISIITQCIGLFVCQYDRCNKFLVSELGYLFITINIVVSCGAGVWNEQIIKGYQTSVNAQNTMLYGSGILINLVMYFVMPVEWLGAELQGEGFFEGFNSWRVFAVVVANGSVGLVITAVYRYADVVIKTFGLAGSTTILYVLEGLNVLPSGKKVAPMSLTLAGASVVFYASYLYMAPPKLRALTDLEAKALKSEEGGGGEAHPQQQQQHVSGKEPVELARDKRVGLLCGLSIAALLLLGMYPFPCLSKVVDVNAVAAAAALAVQQKGAAQQNTEG